MLANLVVDTILMLAAMAVLLGLIVFVVWDYLQTLAGRTTFSEMMLSLWARRRHEPRFWLLTGTCVGFTLGTVLGFILGHLFWPQWVNGP